MKIYLSPSSQEHNIGVVPGYIEEAICNRIADACQKILIAAGQEVMRNNPANPYNVHTDESNAWGADVHAPIHTNASTGTARGARVGCFAPTELTRPSTILAKKVLARIEPITPGQDLLTKYTFDEVSRTKAPSAYIEVSYHDNLEDCNWILANVELIGKTIALGILDFLGIEYHEATLPPPNWQGQLTERDEKITFLTAEIAAGQKRIGELTQQNEALQTELSNLRTELIGWQAAAENFRADSDKLRAMIHTYVSARDALDGA